MREEFGPVTMYPESIVIKMYTIVIGGKLIDQLFTYFFVCYFSLFAVIFFCCFLLKHFVSSFSSQLKQFQFFFPFVDFYAICFVRSLRFLFFLLRTYTHFLCVYVVRSSNKLVILFSLDVKFCSTIASVVQYFYYFLYLFFFSALLASG